MNKQALFSYPKGLAAVLVVTATMTMLSACVGLQPKPPDGPSSSQDFVGHLVPAKFEDEFNDPFKDRAFAPNISSYRDNPGGALGSIYVRMAKDGKTCGSQEPTDFKFDTIFAPSLTSSCKIIPATRTDLITKKVQGGQAASIAYLVGDVAASREFAFELYLSEPMAAVYDNWQECIDVKKVAQARLPERTCEVRFIKGIVLTQFSWRTYTSNSEHATAAFTVAKIGGNTYYNATDIITKSILTVDTANLSPQFTKNGDFYTTNNSVETSKKIKTFKLLSEQERTSLFSVSKEADAIQTKSVKSDLYREANSRDRAVFKEDEAGTAIKGF